jgi:hypothetical protein
MPVCHGAWTWRVCDVLVLVVFRAAHSARWAASSWDVALTRLPIVRPFARGCT